VSLAAKPLLIRGYARQLACRVVALVVPGV